LRLFKFYERTTFQMHGKIRTGSCNFQPVQNYLYIMKYALAAFTFTLCSLGNFAQHCPWDCSGMIMMRTPVSKEMIYKLKPVLVDEQKNVVTDTMYGTGLPTYDRCDFLSYEDFVDYRAGKITVHHWYGYDTVYHFAAGNFIVKYNFCKYEGSKLFLRFDDPGSEAVQYHYIEIPEAIRIHLHNISSLLYSRQTAAIRKELQHSILNIACSEWGLKDEYCKKQQKLR
jgi:hypothetical protein